MTKQLYFVIQSFMMRLHEVVSRVAFAKLGERSVRSEALTLLNRVQFLPNLGITFITTKDALKIVYMYYMTIIQPKKSKTTRGIFRCKIKLSYPH